MDFIGKIEITAVETIGIYKIGSTKTMIECSLTWANTSKEMLQMSDIMFTQYAAP